ncbi:response regulator [Sphingomonas sp. SFZ2018-12]|uniref:response regulator n=1 Tax=Sphingomonas sp. SFZ2018-12 TaxID=2683197 RepID=UPI001F10101B|nr:response regulator [Sphingomonas sp. SFZ2018-12]MCH4892649.1 response regulator [Sphingomonas sp. SFZ2018-12]
MTKLERILIVEDEPLIAMMLEDFIDVLGKQVAGVADTVEDAIARIDAGDIDAAILDLHLRGGEHSTPVAERLTRAGIPFIVSTGGSGEMIGGGRHPVLAKPFTLDAVGAAFDRLTENMTAGS